nr:hypothetical protein [uncultured bacterium]
MGWTVNPMFRLSRFESYHPHIYLKRKNYRIIISGSSSVGRASAFQAEGRGFESRLPLQIFLHILHFLSYANVVKG